MSADAIPTITADEFEARTKDALIVHIAGKGNMPEDAGIEDRMLDVKNSGKGKEPDDEKMYKMYTTYVKNYVAVDEPYKSFKMQAEVFEDLNDNVEAEFHEILLKVNSIFEGLQRHQLYGNPPPSRLVFTFDGDNYQENSPFTKGIRVLIRAKYAVYAFKDKPPSKPKHFESWVEEAKAPYTALVDLKGTAPKDYTKPRCDVYVSYGYPLLVSIYQPQEDEEIINSETDKYGRIRPSELSCPGLVLSSLSSELSDAFKDTFSISYVPRSYRYLMLYHRKPNVARA